MRRVGSTGPPKTDFPSRPVDRVGGRLEFVDEFLQLLWIDVADGKEFETLRGPAPDVEPLHRVELRPVLFRARCLRDEEIDHMLPASIDDGSDVLSVDIVESSADQREALRREVHHRRREVELGEKGVTG